MADVRKTLKDEFDKIWPEAKRNLTKLTKDMRKVVKKGEQNLVETYKTAKKKTEKLVCQVKREELYYELGKSVASLLTSDQLKNKKILQISMDIQHLNKMLRKAGR